MLPSIHSCRCRFTEDVVVNLGVSEEYAPIILGCSVVPVFDDLLLDGLALLITKGHQAAAPTLKRALSAFSSASPAWVMRLKSSGLRACRYSSIARS